MLVQLLYTLGRIIGGVESNENQGQIKLSKESLLRERQTNGKINFQYPDCKYMIDKIVANCVRCLIGLLFGVH